MIPGDDLALTRSHPQASNLYLIVQQPERRTSGDLYADPWWTDYLWYCRINGDPAGDPIVQLNVNLGGPAPPVTLHDGMTVFISGTEYGYWDKAVVRLRGDQVVGPGTVTLDIAVSSDIAGVVKNGDYVVVLDELRLWQRYGRVTAVGGVITWYKEYDLLWSALPAPDATRRLAAMPPVPIMGPHAVKFVDPPATGAQFWFDWTDSYATAPAAAVGTWASWGVQDHAYNLWNSGAQVPGWQQVNAISGLKGFRTWLEVNDGNGDATTLPYRRGARYIFTLRRPGQIQPGDPPNAEPLTHFKLNSPISGSFDQGYWKTSITVFEDQAYDHVIIPGALVILFTEDYYTADDPYLSPHGVRRESVGPIFDRENILFVGRIADSSIDIDPETQDITFDVMSTGEEAATYVNYPIVIQNNDAATDWLDTPDLTVDRAVRHYVAWHTTLSLIADVYQTEDDTEIWAMDFMAGDIYNALDSFLKARLFARLLSDKYGRFFCEIDVQMQLYGSVPTLWVLDDGDWTDVIRVQRSEVFKGKAAECGGLILQAGASVPKLSRAPGSFDKYRGTTFTGNFLAITDQDALNILSGRFLEYINNSTPEISMSLAGNWRYCDIVPQEAFNGVIPTVRGDAEGRHILREVSNEYVQNVGAIFTSIRVETEAKDGVPGITVDVPEELPEVPLPDYGLPDNPYFPPFGGEDLGMRILATDVGVAVTKNVGDVDPYFFMVNNGFVTADDLTVYSISRDPFHWWTSDGAERTLWAGTASGIWCHGPTATFPADVSFPHGTWRHRITVAQINAITGMAYPRIYYTQMDMSIELEGRLAFACYYPGGLAAYRYHFQVVQNGVMLNTWCPWPCGGNLGTTWPDIKFAQHSGGMTVYACRPAYDATNFSRLYRTPDGGVTWENPANNYIDVTPLTNSNVPTISVPYVDAANPDNFILWGDRRGHRISVVGGAKFTYNNLPLVPMQGYSKIGTGGHPDYIWLLYITPSNVACRWSNDRGLTWTLLPLVPGWVGGDSTRTSYVEWVGDTLSTALIGHVGVAIGVEDNILMLWKQGQASWMDKSGNLHVYGVRSINDIERDSMGSA